MPTRCNVSLGKGGSAIAVAFTEEIEVPTWTSQRSLESVQSPEKTSPSAPAASKKALTCWNRATIDAAKLSLCWTMNEVTNNRAKRAKQDGTFSGASSTDTPVSEAASSPTSILPKKQLAFSRTNKDLPRRIFVPDDRAKRGMHDDTFCSGTPQDVAPRKPPILRNRDLPRRVLLPGGTTGPVSSRKRHASAPAPASSRRKKQLKEETSEASLHVELAAPVAEVADSTLGSPSSPRTPPSSAPVAPVTPMAPLKRERIMERLPATSRGTHRRLNFEDM